MGMALSVVTPEEVLVETEATAVVLRSSDGDLTVLDGHTPLVTDVVPGQVRVETEGSPALRLAVHGGYLQVETGRGPDGGDRRTRVTLLAGTAERAGDIDVARAERAKAEAEAELAAAVLSRGSGGGGSGGSGGAGETSPEVPAEVRSAEAALRRAEVRLEIAAGG